MPRRVPGQRAPLLLAVLMSAAIAQACSPRPGIGSFGRGPEDAHGCYEVRFRDWGPEHAERLGFVPPASITLTELHDENLLTPRFRDVEADWYSFEIGEGFEQQYQYVRDHEGSRYRVARWPERTGEWISVSWTAWNAGLSVSFRPMPDPDPTPAEAIVRWWPLDWGQGLPFLTASVTRRTCPVGVPAGPQR